MQKIKVNIKAERYVPEYKTPESAGCDLCNNGNAIAIHPFTRAFIQTGVSIELPQGYEAQVRGRSGLNKNHGIVVPVGTIDSDYRGEIGVVVYNLSNEPYIVNPGERIAQLVISPVRQAAWNEVAEFQATERGNNGFGSTGK